MAVNPEREEVRTPPQEVKEVIETPEIPEHIEKAGVRPRDDQFKAQVTDDSGQQLIQTPSTRQVSITIPAPQSQLQDWAKGSPSDALTWFASFWLRMIKKAARFGWKVVRGGS